jgi:hypothetical protein
VLSAVHKSKHSTGHGIPSHPRKMELGVRLRSCQPPPNTSQPPPTAISFGTWPRSSHLAVLRGRPCPRPRRARAPRVAAPDSRPLETIRADSVGQGTKLRFARVPCRALVRAFVRVAFLGWKGINATRAGGTSSSLWR